MKFRIHPLFLLFGVLTAFTGQLLLFLIATVAAVEHECAHAFCARRMGYTLDKIVLMPYGAVISGDISGIPPKEELSVCVAGPLANGATALLFIAVWWLYPEAYPYTEAAAYISASLFLVNLLPAYPLDGGRMLKIALRPLGEKRARIVCLSVSLLISAGVLAYFRARLERARFFRLSRGGVVWRRKLLPHSLFAQKELCARRRGTADRHFRTGNGGIRRPLSARGQIRRVRFIRGRGVLRRAFRRGIPFGRGKGGFFSSSAGIIAKFLNVCY